MQFVATRMLLYGAWHHWFLFCRQECRYWCLTPVLTIATSCMHSIGSSAMRESTWLCVVWVPQSMERDPHTHSTTHRMRRSRLCWVELITATTLLTVCIQRGANNASGHCKWKTVPRYSRSLGPVWARGRCRISPPRFLAECCKRQLNQVSFVSLYFRLSTFSDLYWVCLFICIFLYCFVCLYQSSDWLWRPPPKWPILCRVGH